jgi:drug/metabolite transporter (DMT)-like permease
VTRNAPGLRWRADLALIFITFIWGATFILVQRALADASTLLFLALRFSLATIALGLAFRPLASKLGQARRMLGGAVLAGVCLFAGYLLQTVGLRYTTASKSAFITGLCIVIVPVFAAVVKRKKPQAAEVLGVVVATCGLGLLTLGGTEVLRIGRGDLLTVGCAVAFAAQILVVDHWAPKIGFDAFTLVQIATAACLALGSFWWVEPPVIRWSLVVVGALTVTGLLATALAFAVQAWAQQYTSPTRTALIFAMEPVFAWGTSFVVAGEMLSRRASLGAALILAGILLVELQPFGLRRRKGQ